MYVGEYQPASAPGVVFKVTYQERRKGITFQRDERQFRFLMARGNHVFNPGGAQDVQITFEVRDGVAQSLTITDGSRVVSANRI